MWQVYLMLANERQATEQRKAAEPHVERAPRTRRWRTGRRTDGPVAATGTRSDATTVTTH